MQLLHSRMVTGCGMLLYSTVGLGLRTAFIVQPQDCQNFCQNRLVLPILFDQDSFICLSASALRVFVFQTEFNCTWILQPHQGLCFNTVQVSGSTGSITCNKLQACVNYQSHGNKQKLHLPGLNNLCFITTVCQSLFHRHI